MNNTTVYVGMDVHKESFTLLKIAKVNSTLISCNRFYFCISGV